MAGPSSSTRGDCSGQQVSAASATGYPNWRPIIARWSRPTVLAVRRTLPLRAGAGRIIGTFGISRDVTAQVRAENTLAHSSPLGPRPEPRELPSLLPPLASIIGYVEF